MSEKKAGKAEEARNVVVAAAASDGDSRDDATSDMQPDTGNSGRDKQPETGNKAMAVAASNGDQQPETGDRVYSLPSNTKNNGGRDEKGRFVPGYAGGPGRPPKRQEQAYIDAIYGNVSPDEWGRATRKILQHVLETGSIRAWAVLAERVAGPIPKHVKHEDVASPQDWLAAMLGDDVGDGADDDTDTG